MGSVILQEEQAGEESDSERERQELLALIERQSQEISQLQEQVRVFVSQVSWRQELLQSQEISQLQEQARVLVSQVS